MTMSSCKLHFNVRKHFSTQYFSRKKIISKSRCCRLESIWWSYKYLRTYWHVENIITLPFWRFISDGKITSNDEPHVSQMKHIRLLVGKKKYFQWNNFWYPVRHFPVKNKYVRWQIAFWDTIWPLLTTFSFVVTTHSIQSRNSLCLDSFVSCL